MGLVAAATVAVTVAVAVTVSPAVLSLMKTRVVSKRGWRAHGFTVPGDLTTRTVTGEEREEEHGAWYVGLVTRRPWLTVLAVVAVLGVAAIPVSQIQLGPGRRRQRGHGHERAHGLHDHRRRVRARRQRADHRGRHPPRAGDAPAPTPRCSNAQARIATDLMSVDGVTSVLPFGVSADKSTLAFQVVPATGPADPATVDTVRAIHFSADTYARHTGTEIGLTGSTVANIEISERLGAALPPYLLVVVGLSLVILMLVFRSLVVPVVATGGFLLSVGAAFGITVAVHQWGWLGSWLGVNQPGPLLSFMPIIVIGVLFGLAMDYQMFLVSGMHEARSHGEDSRTAVRTGFVHGAKVVTAAAIIMTSVFLGFAFSHLVMIRPIGFALAVGVLVDAVLVRMTLDPGGHAPARRPRLVHPALARPAAPRPRRRGRQAGRAAAVGRAGRRAHGIRAGAGARAGRPGAGQGARDRPGLSPVRGSPGPTPPALRATCTRFLPRRPCENRA